MKDLLLIFLACLALVIWFRADHTARYNHMCHTHLTLATLFPPPAVLRNVCPGELF